MGNVQEKIAKIFSQPEENCFLSDNPESTETYFQYSNNVKNLQAHEIAWVLAGICTFFSVTLSIYLIYKHACNYRGPDQQKLIIRILLMVPIYAIDSFLSFRFYWISIYFDLIRDCYEAFVINTFFSLMIEYMGGYYHSKQVLAEHEGDITLVVPLCCVKVKPRRGILRTLKRVTLQYVVIRPMMAILAVILQAVNLYCPGNWNFSRGYIFITFVLFCSVTAAMYALVMFYTLGKDEMARYKPIGKFLSIKFVIFLSFWQSIAVSGLVAVGAIKGTAHWSTDDVADGVQNVLICFEMVFCAVMHMFVFSYKEYAEPGKETSFRKSLAHAFNPVDVASDIYYSFNPAIYAKKKKQKRKQERDEDSRSESQNTDSELIERNSTRSSTTTNPSSAHTSVSITIVEENGAGNGKMSRPHSVHSEASEISEVSDL